MRNKSDFCKNGHPYFGENLGTTKKGFRLCKKCRYESVRKSRAKKVEYYREFDRNYNNKLYKIDSSKKRKYVKTWVGKNPEKIKAHNILNYLIKKNEIKRKPCEVCGKEKVDAHHHDYSKPLEVKWLCRLHHKLEHSLLDKR